MIRMMIVLWIVLAASVGVGLFLLKHEVQALEEQLAQTNRAIRVTQKGIHVLKAEWSFLNDPARLHRLAARHLGMTPLRPEQLTVAAALPAMLDGLARRLPSATAGRVPLPTPATTRNEREVARGNAGGRSSGTLVLAMRRAVSAVSAVKAPSVEAASNLPVRVIMTTKR
ncbi:MAG: hypothetical protein FD149_2580 [Rhodospirillaceae bacterium]|nr:MAG: hypothetical protein FD149_2580 [Rhodospirillaceae bacterium]